MKNHIIDSLSISILWFLTLLTGCSPPLKLYQEEIYRRELCFESLDCLFQSGLAKSRNDLGTENTDYSISYFKCNISVVYTKILKITQFRSW